MNSAAPQILVVARHGDAGASEAVREALAAQTYPYTRLVLLHEDEEKPIFSDATSDFCPQGKFAAHVKKSGAPYVLFWPVSGTPQPAAIEKLLLALHLAPDQEAVADANRGTFGFWLVRNNAATLPLISLWPVSVARWINECQLRQPAFFYIPENLSEAATPSVSHRPFAVENFFGKLPPRWENYQSIITEPLWKIPETTPDPQSVLFLVTSLPMGGACKFILDVAAQLKARGSRVTVATTTFDLQNPHPWLGELLRIVPDVFILSHARPVELPRQIAHLARTRNCGRVVVSHSMLGYQLLPWLRKELPGVAFLDYTHIEYETEWPNGGYALRSRNSQSLLDLSLVSSDHLCEWMVERGADADALRVCHTNIDAEKWTVSNDMRARERYELGLDGKAAMILYPCRLAEQKRPELLCNIVTALRLATKAPFVVVIAGDGPLMGPLRRFAERERLEDHVRVLGAVSLERVARLHGASDIFLLPSLIEGISLALFEAMAMGSVPVVSDVGGQRELVTPDCGELITVRHPAKELADYVAALKFLLENPDQRRAMSVACRARVCDHFRLDQMAQTFVAALDEATLRLSRRAPLLPDPALCREMAALAIDQIRISQIGAERLEQAHLVHDKLCKAEKANQKLLRQLETLRQRLPVPEANELAC